LQVQDIMTQHLNVQTCSKSEFHFWHSNILQAIGEREMKKRKIIGRMKYV
jgi:hypothetical protein